jgi:4'-phosphopantetheinyl transferase EntD
MTTRLANSARASALLAELFPPSVVAYELRGSADPATLLPEEAGTCDAFRPQRLAEFAAGRQCARRALGDLRFPDFAVRRNADRTPRWPELVVGSITHTIGYCGAVAALRTQFAGLGVDAEIAARVTADLWAHVFTTDEIAQFPRLDAAQRERLAAVVFSAKEALYKGQFGITGRWLDYSDVSVEVVPEEDHKGAFVARPATSNARCILRDAQPRGRYHVDGALVVTGIAITLEDARLLARPRAVVA